MVSPLLFAGGAAQLGSMGLNMLAQGQVDAARAAAQRAENDRQDRWDNQIFGLQRETAGKYDNFAPKMADRAHSVEDFYRSSGGDIPSSGPTAGKIPAMTNPALIHEGQNQQGRVAAFTGQQNHAQANLRSFGDIMADASRTAAVNNGVTAIIANQKQGSTSVLPLELQSANNAGNGIKTFADILGGLGKAGVSAGLGGFDPFGGGGLFGTGDPISNSIAGPQAPGLFTRMRA